jgi:hypothetical protein
MDKNTLFWLWWRSPPLVPQKTVHTCHHEHILAICSRPKIVVLSLKRVFRAPVCLQGLVDPKAGIAICMHNSGHEGPLQMSR